MLYYYDIMPMDLLVTEQILHYYYILYSSNMPMWQRLTQHHSGVLMQFTHSCIFFLMNSINQINDILTVNITTHTETA